MATGVRGKERLSDHAPTVASDDLAGGELPPKGMQAHLVYPGKQSEREILSSQPGRYFSITRNADRAPAIPGPNAFLLSDNQSAIAALIETGLRADLVYLDPPYGTGSGFQSRALTHAYEDDRDGARYLESLRRRLVLLRDCMADDASIYVHIGHQMVGHLKVLLDEIFGPQNFRNIIARRKCSSKNSTRKSYANLHDFLLFYSRSKTYKWNQPGEEPSEEWIDKEYPWRDSKGRYKLVPIHAPGTRNGSTGTAWRGMLPPPGKHWQFTPVRLEELDKRGEMHWSKNGNPRRKVYLTKDKMIALTDHWQNFRDAHHQSVEITGYPTEKNVFMLQKIVEASSCENDVVVDPYCGSGTTLEAASLAGRRWLGIDQSFIAAEATLRQ